MYVENLNSFEDMYFLSGLLPCQSKPALEILCTSREMTMSKEFQSIQRNFNLEKCLGQKNFKLFREILI